MKLIMNMNMNNNKINREIDIGIDNLDDIAMSIFTKLPGEPNSIQLELEEETANMANKNGVDEYVFNILLLITYKGIKILFGDSCCLMSLELNQYELIRKYTRSYGYEMSIKANESNITPWECDEEIINYKIFFDKIR